MKSLYDEAIESLEEGEFEQAERQFAEFLREYPRDAMALNKMGLVYVKQRMLSKAIVYKQKYRLGDYLRERQIARRLEKSKGGEKNLLREFFLLLRGK